MNSRRYLKSSVQSMAAILIFLPINTVFFVGFARGKENLPEFTSARHLNFFRKHNGVGTESNFDVEELPRFIAVSDETEMQKYVDLLTLTISCSPPANKENREGGYYYWADSYEYKTNRSKLIIISKQNTSNTAPPPFSSSFVKTYVAPFPAIGRIGRQGNSISIECGGIKDCFDVTTELSCKGAGCVQSTGGWPKSKSNILKITLCDTVSARDAIEALNRIIKD